MEQTPQIHLASDHRGYGLKLRVNNFLEEQGYTVLDHGCHSLDSADYPGFAIAAAEAAAAMPGALAIVICGSGMGVSISANKVPGARCAVAWCEAVAEFARRHNNANVLAFSADLQTFTQVQRCLNAFLHAGFEGGRHQRRLDQIASFETSCGR
jgi:ribose 5-phosphate isomerase B